MPGHLFNTLDKLRPPDRRTRGRVRVELTETNLGRVIDLSSTGMKVASRWGQRLEKGQRVRVKIRSVYGNLDIAAQVMWITKQGWLKQELGLHFLELDEGQKKLLTHIGRSAASNECVRHPSLRDAA